MPADVLGVLHHVLHGAQPQRLQIIGRRQRNFRLGGRRGAEVQARGAGQALHVGVTAQRAGEQPAIALRSLVLVGREPAFEAMVLRAAKVEDFHW
jgi:hypothetical protein